MSARRICFQERANGEPRPKRPRRGGVLGRSCEPPPHQLGSLGRCKLPQRGQGRAPAQIDFCTIFDL